MPSLVGNKPNQVPTNGDLGLLAFRDYVGVIANGNAAPTVASAASIRVTTPVAFVSGTTTINTIEVMPEMVGGGQIILIPTGLWSTGTSGNIALATTAVVSRAVIMVYDAVTTKWYPSY
jgi:hypothetical protein